MSSADIVVGPRAYVASCRARARPSRDAGEIAPHNLASAVAVSCSFEKTKELGRSIIFLVIIPSYRFVSTISIAGDLIKRTHINVELQSL